MFFAIPNQSGSSYNARDRPPGKRVIMFITFEGVDGSGKSTQARALHRHLVASGVDAVLTREPGGSPGAEDIRALVLNGDSGRWSPDTELLLFTAARRDHLERLIEPALARGAIVISDRFADTTRVYQGMDAPERREMADQLHRLMIGREPDLTLVFDIDPEIALARAVQRSGKMDAKTAEMRFESRGLSFQAAARAGFLGLAREFPERIEVIDADMPAEVLSERIRELVEARLPRAPALTA